MHWGLCYTRKAPPPQIILCFKYAWQWTTWHKTLWSLDPGWLSQSELSLHSHLFVVLFRAWTPTETPYGHCWDLFTPENNLPLCSCRQHHYSSEVSQTQKTWSGKRTHSAEIQWEEQQEWGRVTVDEKD